MILPRISEVSENFMNVLILKKTLSDVSCVTFHKYICQIPRQCLQLWNSDEEKMTPFCAYCANKSYHAMIVKHFLLR